MVQETAHGLDRGPGIAAQLRRRVTEDVQPARGEPGLPQIPSEPGVERRARDAPCPGPSLPERRTLVHVGEGEPGIGQRGTQRVVGGVGEFATTALAALAAIRVEGRLVLDADVASSETDDFHSPSAGEDEREEERSVPASRHGVGDDG
jgi:hypothetical protein